VKGPASYPNPLLRGPRLGGRVPTAKPWYRFGRYLLRVTVSPFWQVRVFNRHFEPAGGGAVYICNHQSFLDPVLMGMALRRPMNFMARDSLFRIPLFKQLIASVNAFPVRRGTVDFSAIKQAMRHLKAGGQVAVFAEGTRTSDGRIGRFLPGVAVLAQRAAQWTVPVVIDGAFEAWPRSQMLPSPGSVVVQYAPPIPQSDARKMKAEALIESIRQTLIQLQAEVRRRTGRPELQYD